MPTAAVMTPDLVAWAKIARLCLKHIDAGHGVEDPKLRIDLTTALTNNQRIVDTFPPGPASMDAQVAATYREVIRISRAIAAGQETNVGRLEAIAAKLAAADQTARDEAVQVQAHFTRLQEQVATLQTTIDGLIAGQVTDAEIDALGAQVDAIADTVEKIDTEGDEAPPPDETPTP